MPKTSLGSSVSYYCFFHSQVTFCSTRNATQWERPCSQNDSDLIATATLENMLDHVTSSKTPSFLRILLAFVLKKGGRVSIPLIKLSEKKWN